MSNKWYRRWGVECKMCKSMPSWWWLCSKLIRGRLTHICIYLLFFEQEITCSHAWYWQTFLVHYHWCHWHVVRTHPYCGWIIRYCVGTHCCVCIEISLWEQHSIYSWICRRDFAIYRYPSPRYIMVSVNNSSSLVRSEHFASACLTLSFLPHWLVAGWWIHSLAIQILPKHLV